MLGGLRHSGDSTVQAAVGGITQNFVFDHPTLRDLAGAIAELVTPTKKVDDETPVDMIKSFIDRYASALPLKTSKPKVAPGESICVLLTGSTGHIGSHVLALLLREQRVKKVYTLNRAKFSNLNRQRIAFEENRLPVDLLYEDKLVQMFGDLALDEFGLETSEYEEVGRSRSPGFCIFSDVKSRSGVMSLMWSITLGKSTSTCPSGHSSP